MAIHGGLHQKVKYVREKREIHWRKIINGSRKKKKVLPPHPDLNFLLNQMNCPASSPMPSIK